MERILIVEDEPDIREAMADALTNAGYEVLQAKNGLEGLEMATLEQPSLILLDLVMPEMDGTTMLKKLREDPWGRKAKVVVLSAMDDIKNVGTTHEYQIADYIIKTHSSLHEVVNKVREVLYTTP